MGHINKIKTSNGQEYDVQDKRIIEVSAADVGKVLTVESDGSLAFKTPAGGTKLYKHAIYLGQGVALDIVSTDQTAFTALTLVERAIMLSNCIKLGNTDFVTSYTPLEPYPYTCKVIFKSYSDGSISLSSEFSLKDDNTDLSDTVTEL